MKMKIQAIIAATAAGLQCANALDLDLTSPAFIRNASSALAYNLMSWYKNNQSSTAATAVGTLPAPLYWWEAGALWGGMIDYWAYTNDTSYNPTVSQALLAQVGPDNNYMPPAYYSSLGNDDQAFWALAVLTAAEYGLPNPPSGSPQWLDLAEAVFNTMVPRWNTTLCNGGLRWQIFSFNAGYDYRNSISNGGFFQIAARLAHFTGNTTYYDWAEKIWDWTTGVGLISPTYDIYDGTDDTINCSQIDHTQWSYNPGMWIYGSSILYNYTNATSLWANRTAGLLEAANRTFFSPYANASNIMYEPACEPASTCDNDQYSFKAYLSRWLAKTAIVAPFVAPAIHPLLVASAQAAALSCSGGTDGVTCGEKWYLGGYDGVYGVGQQLSGLETVQALLVDDAPGLVRDFAAVGIEAAPTSTLVLPPSSTSTGLAVAESRAMSSGGTGTGAATASARSTKSVDANGAVHRVACVELWVVVVASVFVVSVVWG